MSPLADHLCDAIAAAGAVSSHSAPWNNEGGDRRKLQICKTSVQGRSHQTWSGQLCSRCVQNTGMLAQKHFWNLEAVTLLPRPFLALFGGQTTVSHVWISTLSVHCTVHHRPCVGVCRAVTLSKTHEWGKKWSGWNQTNQTGGYGPAVNVMFAQLRVKCKEVISSCRHIRITW